ncbi:MAG: helicase-related protein [Pirellulales bacterium]
MTTIPRGLKARLARVVGGAVGRRLARWALLLPEIEALEPRVHALSVEALRKHSLALRYRAKSGEPLAKLLPEAFALVREAAVRTLSMRHFDVQLLGGIALSERSIVEMQTGEGKTLTATLPLYLHALTGAGSHLVTANDYLAHRDAEWMRPVFEALGMSVGVIQGPMKRGERRAAYACDVTYGTASEMGFDFLRDRLLLRSQPQGSAAIFASGGPGEKPVARDPHFALVDEADSILIDEARTPLVISAAPTEAQHIQAECFRWAAALREKLPETEHWTYNHKQRSVELNAAGRQAVRTASKPKAADRVPLADLYEHVERAIKVERDFLLDRHYVIRDGEVLIIDECTGRPAEGRKWRDGLHQAIEAKEKVDITFATDHAARITIQDLFVRYPHLAGMTGTASNAASELHKIYDTRVIPIPTHRPPRRQRLPDLVFGTGEAKWAAIVDEVRQVHASGRPVLIGTRSIDKSELVSRLLQEAGIEHAVLNARHIEREAEIIAAAGERGRVTVATNMAGRGTDIKLSEGVSELGGLHVLCTELHDSSRIDRQLIGRCGRQGDPGTWRQFLALDDDVLLLGLGPDSSAALKAIGQKQSGGLERLAPTFHKAQRRIERRHFRDRRLLLYQEKERHKLHSQMGQDAYLDSPS